tara:strand:+ start:1195 stop:1425 length:231 start_codon:yes stop_codon:yes gene_type:complete
MESPRSLDPRDTVFKWNDCPRCAGRGWLLINPFRVGHGCAGGLANMTQCDTCVEAKTIFETGGLDALTEYRAGLPN